MNTSIEFICYIITCEYKFEVIDIHNKIIIGKKKINENRFTV